MDLTPTRTAPDFETDRLGYYVWHLTEHGRVYRAFRTLCDRYREFRPERVVSADMICHVVRYETGLKTPGDEFSLNNNVTPLYARLYKLERPGANVVTRASWLDTLPPGQWAQIEAAFAPLREAAPVPDEGAHGWFRLHAGGQAHHVEGRATLCGIPAPAPRRTVAPEDAAKCPTCARELARQQKGHRR